MSGGWIVIPSWEKWFRYRADRPPVWIKNYLSLRADDDYLGLSLPARGLLHGLWLLYAESGGRVRLDLKMLNRKLGAAAKMREVEALIDAGFIEISGARPPSFGRPRGEENRDPPSPPVNGGVRKGLSEKDLRRYTGCRATRGSHGAGYAHDPLGTDKPPKDWPHPKPTRAEVELHLEIEDR